MFLVDKSQFDWCLFLGKHSPVDKQCKLFALHLKRSPKEKEKRTIRKNDKMNMPRLTHRFYHWSFISLHASRQSTKYWTTCSYPSFTYYWTFHCIHTGRHLTFPVPSLFGHSHPLGHGVHRSLAPNEKVPSSQSSSVEVLVDGQNFPSGHTVQNWAFPTEYVPNEMGKNKNGLKANMDEQPLDLKYWQTLHVIETTVEPH